MVFLAAGGCPGPSEPGDGITFSREVVRLFQDHCQSCHRPGGLAPLPLTTYDEAGPHAFGIQRAVEQGRMPRGVPMRIDRGCADETTFAGRRRLTAGEIDTISRWVEAGAPEGDPADLPPPLEFPAGMWRAGEPDLVVVNADGGFEVPGGLGRDIFRRFPIATDFADDRTLTGLEVIPGIPGLGERLTRAVHGVTLYVDPEGGSPAQEAEFQDSDPEVPGPGFEGAFTYPTTLVGMWLPDSDPIQLGELGDGAGVLVPAGAYLVMEVHYTTYHGGVLDETLVGLHLAGGAPARPLDAVVVESDEFVIPAGAGAAVVEAARTFAAPLTIHWITPQMHQIGADLRVVIDQPDAGEGCLADVEWSFLFQETYRLRQPLALPAGSSVRLRCQYDNSAAGPGQFHQPPEDIPSGESAEEELCRLTLGIERGGF